MNIRLLSVRYGTVFTLELEQYLRCVVPAEMPPTWPLEALKAQAVAARSYAVYANMYPRHKEVGADLCDSTHCQAFNVDSFRSGSTDLAVNVTAGEIIIYQGRVINALYSARCGGHTFDNEKVFLAGNPLPFLRGVVCDCIGQKRGHGVGMCQYGAEAMAEAGASHREILIHYYTGTELGRIPDE